MEIVKLKFNLIRNVQRDCGQYLILSYLSFYVLLLQCRLLIASFLCIVTIVWSQCQGYVYTIQFVFSWWQKLRLLIPDITRRVALVEQVLFTLPVQLSSSLCFSGSHLVYFVQLHVCTFQFYIVTSTTILT